MERLIPGSLHASFCIDENSHQLVEERNCSMKMRFAFIFLLKCVLVVTLLLVLSGKVPKWWT